MRRKAGVGGSPRPLPHALAMPFETYGWCSLWQAKGASERVGSSFGQRLFRLRVAAQTTTCWRDRQRKRSFYRPFESVSFQDVSKQEATCLTTPVLLRPHKVTRPSPPAEELSLLIAATFPREFFRSESISSISKRHSADGRLERIGEPVETIR